MNTLPDSVIVSAGTETAVYLKQEVAQSTEHVVIAPMIHYSQKDDRWAGYEYDPGYTLGGFGCLLTSIAMIGSFYYEDTITPFSLARDLRKIGAFTDGELVNHGYVTRLYPRLHWAGLTNWYTTKADMASIDTELELFDATIIQVLYSAQKGDPVQKNSHFVVLRQLIDNDALIVDPLDGREKPLSTTRYTLPGWTVGRAIYGIRRFRIARDD